MYLKKIHIQGFKSFADKTEIKFKNDITAIVGPNGSGKSNISDAIRWVLGEQSIKSLRGSNMVDVIFAGTNKRRALSFAEVTIFFDNKDGIIPLEYNEVAVTRRMFRSGESEYYINKNSCRLKDIRSLFMDTGIGKDGYSVIGQGKIDEILSNKPEDRRNIFEEAAGIIKYKTKKEEAERKLKNTEENLIRINDLIYEISAQYKRLEKDSKKATEFINIFNELKDLETNIYIKDIKVIDDKKALIIKDKTQVEKEIEEKEKEKLKKQNIFDGLKENMDNREKEIELLRKKREDIIRLKEESKNKVLLLLEKENFCKKDLSRISEELKDMDDEDIILNKELILISEHIDLSSSEHNKLISQYEIKEKQFNYIDKKSIDTEKYIDDKKNEISLLYEKIADKKGELNNIDSLSLNSDKKILELKDEEKKLYEKIKKISENIQKLNDDKKTIELNQERLFKDKEIYGLENNKIKEKIDENFQKIKELEMQIERISSGYKLYKTMENSYEGYYKSVKNLLKALKDNNLENKGFHGIVADLLSVNEKYEIAINISLGGNLQNIVVDNEKNAKSMISYLKTNKLGRVTFLPIDTIKGNELAIDMENVKKQGVLGLAHRLIKYEKKYEDIFKSLLGRTIVIDNIDNAIKFAKKTNNSYRIVTLEGELLNPGGSLSGGSYKDNINIINRKVKIENMEKILSNLKVDLSNLRTENLVFQKEFKLIEEKIDILKNNIEIDNINLRNIENDKKTFKNEEEFFGKNLEKTRCQIKELINSSRANLEKTLQNKIILKIDIDRLEELKENVKINIDSLTICKENREKAYKDISEIKLSIKLIESKLLNYKNEVKNLKQKKINNKLLKEEKLKEIIVVKKDLEKIILDKQVSETSMQESFKEEVNLKNDIEIKVEDKDKYMNNFYKEQTIIKTLIENISTLERNKNDKDLKLSRLEMERENITSKLLADYKLNIEEAFLLERSIDNIKESRKRIKLLKEKIKHLGNVNLGALEEYREVKQRLEFMETQHNDLIESKESLKDIIRDMEKEMKLNFLNSFEEIKNNFSKVFSELFNGGSAILELENTEDDILKSGIEIKVKPPGKVFQSLSLLSGGEKSLVAVALLFAILKVKPSPFCILDEIDAALDDANISRYTSYLKKINDDTQFILITHRKTSMEIANVLYGVTMEEKGISRIISMKLKENKNELVS
ncbi:chromosome segregation protein SMC [Tissierella creatinophila]|uniref:Chromosome partition protein Smc n=1 Tax=Tissierella creatinophila DSM 6911 TaxID=1123403 RepID=A0A1U7M337_TISCR|nr:chromosome segregation protein SMC [Tissierella creatinophila]OLS01734.1 chromosome partition protein Smc [Tissierella creatinophila DSM 6911]